MKIIGGQKLPNLAPRCHICGINLLADKASTSLSTEYVDKKAGQ
ncbi:MAG: hypothetical protein WBR29_06185 [Gammaproteobacteria bacterium]